MARFSHPAISGKGSTEIGNWTIEGGTIDGDPPTFEGDPLFTGEWTRINGFCQFSINVDFDNIESFGTGQYYLKLPFQSLNNHLISDGCLHDFSGGDQYAIMGHVDAGSDILKLFSTASNGRHVPFEYNVPVTLDNPDNFHIAGSYQVDPTA